MKEIEKLFLTKGLRGLNMYEFNGVVEFYMKSFGIDSEGVDATFLLGKLKQLKLEQLRLDCEADIESGFTAFNGHFYRTNRDDQLNMIGQKDFLKDFPEEAVVYWKTEDAGYISHTREEWMQVYNEGYVQKRDKLFKLDQLRKTVLATTTSEEVVAIGWDVVTPEAPIEEPVAEEAPSTPEEVTETPIETAPEEPVVEDEVAPEGVVTTPEETAPAPEEPVVEEEVTV